MMRFLLASTACACLFAIATVRIHGARGEVISGCALEMVRAGDPLFCATPEDVSGIDVCHDCIDNGHGGSSYCYSYGTDQYCYINYNDPSMPSPTCYTVSAQCGGYRLVFETDSTCSSEPDYLDSCPHSYTSGVGGTAQGVNCDL